MVASYVPDRGDIVWLNFSPQEGHEQAGHRPALVLSPATYNGRVGLALLCPITSRAKGYPFEVRIPDGLPTSGVILSDQLRSVDWRARQAEFRHKIADSVVHEVAAKFSTLLAPQLPEQDAPMP